MKVFQSNVDEGLLYIQDLSLQNLKRKFKRTKHGVEKCSWKIDTLDKLAEQTFNILHSKGS